MNRVQRGFHRFGIISAVATLLLGVALVSWATMVGNTDYREVTAKKLSRIFAVDCETGTALEIQTHLPAGGVEWDVTCIELGDGEILKFSPAQYSTQIEAAKMLLAKREEAQQPLFEKYLALTLGGSLLAALVVYGVFASLGWALAGFAKD